MPPDLISETTTGRAPASPAAKLRRLVIYWAATGVLYLFCAGLVFHEMSAGLISPRLGWPVIWFSIVGLAIFYFLIKAAPRLRIANWHLAFLQAVFAVVYDLLLYSVLKQAHAAVLIGMPVIFVFCAFTLRPKQTIALALLAITGLAIACALLVAYGISQIQVEVINFLLTAIGIVSVAVVTGDLSKLRSRLNAQKRQLEEALVRIETIARTDSLTALANRRRMHELLDQAERNSSGQHSVCVALLDIDHFKAVNDKLGHAGGDEILKAFAQTWRQSVRDKDTFARWGGEEFLLLMPETSLQEAEMIVKRILERVRAEPFAFGGHRVEVTFSAGVVERKPDEKMALTVMRADAAMYSAKAAGRNRVTPGAAERA